MHHTELIGGILRLIDTYMMKALLFIWPLKMVWFQNGNLKQII